MNEDELYDFGQRLLSPAKKDCPECKGTGKKSEPLLVGSGRIKMTELPCRCKTGKLKDNQAYQMDQHVKDMNAQATNALRLPAELVNPSPLEKEPYTRGVYKTRRTGGRKRFR